MNPTLLLGDCAEKMRDLADNSVDAIVTDPPYGLAFMGAKWDNFGGKSCGNDINKFPEHLRIRQVPWAKEGGNE